MTDNVISLTQAVATVPTTTVPTTTASTTAAPVAVPTTVTAADTSSAAPLAGDAFGMLADIGEAIAMGGPVVVILLVMSVAALSILMLKLWQYHRLQLFRACPADSILRLYRQGDVGGALACAEQTRQPQARLMALAMRGAARGDISLQAVREELTRVGAEYLVLLRSYLRPLEVIAALAPLLGLFGTVLGMITAFQSLQTAGSRVDPSLLAGGIWEALLTTAVGLAVAMPVIAVINWLEGRVERTARAMESAVTQVFTADLSR